MEVGKKMGKEVATESKDESDGNGIRLDESVVEAVVRKIEKGGEGRGMNVSVITRSSDP